MRQRDVASDAEATGFRRAAIGGLHDPGAAARHDGETRARQRGADLARELVVAVRFREARRAEHRHAGLLEHEAFERTQELEEDAHGALEVRLARAAPRQEYLLGILDVFEQRCVRGGGRTGVGHGESTGSLRCAGGASGPRCQVCRLGGLWQQVQSPPVHTQEVSS